MYLNVVLSYDCIRYRPTNDNRDSNSLKIVNWYLSMFSSGSSRIIIKLVLLQLSEYLIERLFFTDTTR